MAFSSNIASQVSTWAVRAGGPRRTSPPRRTWDCAKAISASDKRTAPFRHRAEGLLARCGVQQSVIVPGTSRLRRLFHFEQVCRVDLAAVFADTTTPERIIVSRHRLHADNRVAAGCLRRVHAHVGHRLQIMQRSGIASSAGHRQRVGLKSRWGATRRACSWLRARGDAGHLGPNLKGLGPGGPIPGGWNLMAAEVEEVVDPVVGGKEALCLPG